MCYCWRVLHKIQVQRKTSACNNVRKISAIKNTLQLRPTRTGLGPDSRQHRILCRVQCVRRTGSRWGCRLISAAASRCAAVRHIEIGQQHRRIGLPSAGGQFACVELIGERHGEFCMSDFACKCRRKCGQFARVLCVHQFMEVVNHYGMLPARVYESINIGCTARHARHFTSNLSIISYRSSNNLQIFATKLVPDKFYVHFSVWPVLININIWINCNHICLDKSCHCLPFAQDTCSTIFV